MREKNCLRCRERFRPKQSRQRFCSWDCSRKAHPGRPRDEALRGEVRELRRAGLPYREIASRTGRSLSRIGRLVLSMELEGTL